MKQTAVAALQQEQQPLYFGIDYTTTRNKSNEANCGGGVLATAAATQFWYRLLEEDYILHQETQRSKLLWLAALPQQQPLYTI